jgi:hypothetical protein
MSTPSTTLAAPSPVSQTIKPIRNLQELWDAVIVCQTNEQFDTEAMYSVYQVMNPKLTYQDLANTFSGVYASTYWNATFMDATILAKSLAQSLGLDLGKATQYATQAIGQWRGVLSRKNFNDYGSIPISVQAPYSESPDIVCNENSELVLDQLIQQWNNEFWKQPVVGKNYIYLRCQNMSFHGGITAPAVSMFYTAGGFNQPPTSWIQCYTADGNVKTGAVSSLTGGSLAPVSPANPLNLGDRAASEAFYFSPTSSDHVCVIAAVNTEFFTNNPLDISANNWDSTTWITHNGAAAWHNVDPQLKLEDSLKFYNQDSTPEDFYFSALCRNVPVGTKISLRNDDPTAAFDTGVIEVISTSQEIKYPVTLPANYEGTLKVRLESPDGSMLAAGAAVELSLFWHISPTHTRYTEAAQRFTALGVSSNEAKVALNMGSFTIIGRE